MSQKHENVCIETGCWDHLRSSVFCRVTGKNGIKQSTYCIATMAVKLYSEIAACTVMHVEQFQSCNHSQMWACSCCPGYRHIITQLCSKRVRSLGIGLPRFAKQCKIV